MNHSRALFTITTSLLWCWSGVNDPRNAITGCGVTLLLVLSPKLRVGLVTGAHGGPQSMDSEVYLWLLLLIRDEGEGKLEESEWIASRAGNLKVEEVLCRKIPIS